MRSAPIGVNQSSSPRKSEMITTRPARLASSPTLRSAPARPCGSLTPSTATPSRKHAAQRDDPRPRAARRVDVDVPVAERDEPDAPGPPHGKAAEDGGDALGDVGLQSVGGPERHRRRDVEHDPRRQRAVGHVQTHVRLPGARGRCRVDVTNVVADLVRAQLARAPCPGRRRPHAGRRAAPARPAVRARGRAPRAARRRSAPGPGGPGAVRLGVSDGTPSRPVPEVTPLPRGCGRCGRSAARTRRSARGRAGRRS